MAKFNLIRRILGNTIIRRQTYWYTLIYAGPADQGTPQEDYPCSVLPLTLILEKWFLQATTAPRKQCYWFTMATDGYSPALRKNHFICPSHLSLHLSFWRQSNNLVPLKLYINFYLNVSLKSLVSVFANWIISKKFGFPQFWLIDS